MAFDEYSKDPAFKPYDMQMKALTDLARQQEQIENEKARMGEQNRQMSTLGQFAGVANKPVVTAAEIMAKQQPVDQSQDIERVFSEPGKMGMEDAERRQSDLMKRYKMQQQKGSVIQNYLKAKELNKDKELEREYKKETIKALRTKGKQNFVKLTKGQEKVDTEYAKDWVDFKMKGGYKDVQKGLKQLGDVRQKLQESDAITGPIVGNIPFRDVFLPTSKAAQETVEEVVQRNLRLILGAQFTEKEGERLISRAYNPRLDEKENIKRIDRLIAQISGAAEAKAAAGQYFEENGSLKGFAGKIFTKDDFDADYLFGKDEEAQQDDIEELSEEELDKRIAEEEKKQLYKGLVNRGK